MEPIGHAGTLLDSIETGQSTASARTSSTRHPLSGSVGPNIERAIGPGPEAWDSVRRCTYAQVTRMVALRTGDRWPQGRLRRTRWIGPDGHWAWRGSRTAGLTHGRSPVAPLSWRGTGSGNNPTLFLAMVE